MDKLSGISTTTWIACVLYVLVSPHRVCKPEVATDSWAPCRASDFMVFVIIMRRAAGERSPPPLDFFSNALWDARSRKPEDTASMASPDRAADRLATAASVARAPLFSSLSHMEHTDEATGPHSVGDARLFWEKAQTQRT